MDGWIKYDDDDDEIKSGLFGDQVSLWKSGQCWPSKHTWPRWWIYWLGSIDPTSI